jgi:hypothetical protein
VVKGQGRKNTRSLVSCLLEHMWSKIHVNLKMHRHVTIDRTRRHATGLSGGRVRKQSDVWFEHVA